MSATLPSTDDVAVIALLAAWLGATIIVGAVVAPAAFAVLPTRTLAGAVVGRVLPPLFWSGAVIGVIRGGDGATFARMSTFVAALVIVAASLQCAAHRRAAHRSGPRVGRRSDRRAAARRCATSRLRATARRERRAARPRRHCRLRHPSAHCAGRAGLRSPLTLRNESRQCLTRSAPRKIHSARSRSPPTRCTACRRCARDRTSRSADCGRSGRSSSRRSGSRRRRRSRTRRRAASTRGSPMPSCRRRTRCSPVSTRDQFIVDPYQAGAGTSHNMNVNEVLANRANEMLGGERGTYSPVHPNDHVNMAQSTNDTIPTNIRLACCRSWMDFTEAFEKLRDALAAKGREFDHIVKAGRTHLQDAMPIRLGQEFTAYAGSIERGVRRVREAADYLRDLGIGGSAVGTGVTVEKEYPALMNKYLRADHRARAAHRQRSHPAHAEHGRRRRVQRGDARARDRSEQDRQRSAPHGHGAAHRHRRDQAARRAARLVDHAGQDQPVDSRDGESGLLPGHGAATRPSPSPPSTGSSS